MNAAAPPCAIVPYEPRYRAGVARLQQRLWSDDTELNLRYLDWKYLQTPWRQGRVYLACAGDEVIAMRGFWDSCWEWGRNGDRLACYVADDLVVAAAWENRGIFDRLMRHALADLTARGERYVLNLGASPVNYLASLATGWRATEALGALRRAPTRRYRSAQLRAQLQRTPLLWRLARHPLLDSPEERRHFGTFDRLARARHALDPAVTVTSEPRLDAMIGLIDRLGHDGRLRMRRDLGYLQWRLANPFKLQRFLFWEDDHGLQGYAILEKNISRAGNRFEVRLADLEATGPAVLEGLVKASVALVVDLEIFAEEKALPAGAAGLLHASGLAPVAKREALPHLRPAVLLRALQDPDPRAPWMLGELDLGKVASWDMRRLYGM